MAGVVPSVSCLVPTGHLSYAPMESESFYRGLEEHPGTIIPLFDLEIPDEV